MDDDQHSPENDAVPPVVTDPGTAAVPAIEGSAPSRIAPAPRVSEADLNLLANSIPQLAWMAGQDGSIFWYNQRWYDTKRHLL